MSQLLLEGKVDDRDLIIDGLRRRVAQLEEELQAERSKANSVEAGAMQLRAALNPLYTALRRIYGQMDEMGIEDAPPTTKGPRRASEAWESWKQKLGGKPAQAIDTLLLHGEMNAPQLRIHLQCGRDYVYNVISILHKANLINKNGGRISLKEL
jgi:hypothetical protein